MSRITSIMLVSLLSLTILGCSGKQITANAEPNVPSKTNAVTTAAHSKIKIIVNGKILIATLENNAASKALLEKLPMTLPMLNLYDREMAYRFGADFLPTENLRSDNYQVGDIVYWPPRGSLVILYAQNGEQFTRQHLGHIDNGVEFLQNVGNTNVIWEVMP